MASLRMFLLGIAVVVSGFGADFKLPEKFLVFDPSRIFSIASSAVPKAGQLTLHKPKPKMDACAHIRIVTPPSDLDPGIASPESNYSQSKMPVLQVPPACQTQGR